MAASASQTWYGGTHYITAALRNGLASIGVLAPHTGQPYTEAMLLGIGGGLGAGYFVFEYGSEPNVHLGFRHRWQDGRAFQANLCERLSLPFEFLETRAPRSAAKQLAQALTVDQATIVWVDQPRLPYRHQPGWLAYNYDDVIRVVGQAEGYLLVDDLAGEPWRVAPEALATARAGIASIKHRLLTVGCPAQPPILEHAIRAGIAASCEGLLGQTGTRFAGNFGLRALEKWASLIANERDPKGWPSVFANGRSLFRALANVYHLVETAGTGGGAMRALYATFLDEARAALGWTELTPIALRYRALAADWTAFARATLPAEVPLLGQARALLDERAALLHSGGPAVAEALRDIGERLASVEAEAATAFPLDEHERLELLRTLERLLSAICVAETEAATALQSALAD